MEMPAHRVLANEGWGGNPCTDPFMP
jgi:hypothetical protein